MEPINYIQQPEKLYLSPYYIPCGNYTITDNSLETAIKYLWSSHNLKINYKTIKYSMDDRFIEPITFVNCFNKDEGIYYYALQRPSFKNFVLTHRNIKHISRRIALNASILVYINNINPLYEDVYRMRYWFLLIARFYAKRIDNIIVSDLTVNELLNECCSIWRDMKDNGELLPMMLGQSINNCRHKTFTKGQISPSEKNSLSHQKKFTEEDKDFILFCKNVQNMKDREIVEAFKENRGKSISLGMISKILNNSEKACSQPGPSVQVNVFENTDEKIQKEEIPQVSWDEFYAFGEQGPGCEQAQSEARVTYAVENDWDNDLDMLDSLINSASE